MRKILFIMLLALLAAGASAAKAQDSQVNEPYPAIEVADSTLEVIGYFSKNDTLMYWISQTRWKISPGDTVKTAGLSTKVRLVVTDSTSTGYKMDYTFMDFVGDTVSDSQLSNFQNRIVEKLSKKIVGTTIRFETDELGVITNYENLGQIKRQAKSLFKNAMGELMKMPEIASLKKEYGFDIKKLTKDVDTDQLVDGYLEELKLLFLCHGLSFDLGQKQVHEDASETTYENDTYTNVQVDMSDYTYSISTDVVSTIPKSVLKDVVGEIVGMFGDESIAGAFAEQYDAQMGEDAICDSFFSCDYLPTGWPYKVVNQTAFSVSGYGKVNQTYIYLDYINY